MQDKQKTQKRRMMATSIASPFASMIAKFVMHPIDTIKSKVQVNRIALKSVTDYKSGMVANIGTFDMNSVKETFKNEGVAGFFRGVTISVIGSAFAFAFYMSAYEHTKHYLGQYEVKNGLKKFFKKYSALSHLLSGFAAEIVSCSLWLPIDIIKERMQVQSEIKLYSYKSPTEAMQKIHKSEGLVGLYRAFGATLLFFGPFSAIFFTTFEKFKEIFVRDRQNQTLTESILCSSMAGAVAGWATTPLEIVKLRMQIQRADVAQRGGRLEDSVFGYRNAFHGLSLLVKNQGFFSLFKGAFLRICFSVPITTISMTLTQHFKQIILKEKEFLDRFI